jgi:hypothetical protein
MKNQCALCRDFNARHKHALLMHVELVRQLRSAELERVGEDALNTFLFAVSTAQQKRAESLTALRKHQAKEHSKKLSAVRKRASLNSKMQILARLPAAVKRCVQGPQDGHQRDCAFGVCPHVRKTQTPKLRPLGAVLLIGRCFVPTWLR